MKSAAFCNMCRFTQIVITSDANCNKLFHNIVLWHCFCSLPFRRNAAECSNTKDVIMGVTIVCCSFYVFVFLSFSWRKSQCLKAAIQIKVDKRKLFMASEHFQGFLFWFCLINLCGIGIEIFFFTVVNDILKLATCSIDLIYYLPWVIRLKRKAVWKT